MREFGRRDDRGVGDLDAVMRFVLLLQTAQNRDGVLDRRFVDHDLLETTLQRRVLFDVLAVFVKRGRTDHMEFAARERRLQHVARVHAAFGLPGAHHRVEFVDEEDDAALFLRDFFKKLLQTFLEFAAVLGARDEARHVEAQHALPLQGVGDFAVDDSLRKPFDDGGLADAGFADQHGIVLAAALQNLHRAADFVVAPDHGVELAAAREVGEVDRVLLERFALAFGVGVVRAVAAAHGGDRHFHGASRKPAFAREATRLALVFAERKQEHFGGDVAVVALHRLLFREVENVPEFTRNLNVAVRARDARHRAKTLFNAPFELSDVHAGALEKTAACVLGILQQSGQEVNGFEHLMVVRQGDGLRVAERLLKFRGQFVLTHEFLSSFRRTVDDVMF